MWGERQLIEYKGMIDRASSSIAKNPEEGRKRTESKLQFCRVGEHLIFYQTNGETVFVVRILHGQMNIDFHLKE